MGKRYMVEITEVNNTGKGCAGIIVILIIIAIIASAGGSDSNSSGKKENDKVEQSETGAKERGDNEEPWSSSKSEASSFEEIVSSTDSSSGESSGMVETISYEQTSSDTTSFSTPALKVGDRYEGGIIFYLDNTGQHGLIAAPNDLSSGIAWWNGAYINTGTYDVSVGAGDINTKIIISEQGSGSYAASICADYTGGGFTGWFLPSKSELQLLYEQKDIIGGFAPNKYWTSSQRNGTNSLGNYANAWYIDFETGVIDFNHWGTDNLYRVRPVRAF